MSVSDLILRDHFLIFYQQDDEYVPILKIEIISDRRTTFENHQCIYQTQTIKSKSSL
jgi:hypothetical protein